MNRNERKDKVLQRHKARGKDSVKRWQESASLPSLPSGFKDYLVTLNADFEIDSKAYEGLEREIVARNFKIIQKTANRYEDSIVIRTDNPEVMALSKLPGIDLVFPKLNVKSLETINGVENVSYVPSGQTCTLDQASLQAPVVDFLQQDPAKIQNHGGGVILIIWDLFYDPKHVQVNREHIDRAGGGVIIIGDDASFVASSSGVEHGAMVSSVAAGNNVGIAKKSNLIWMAASNDVTSDLARIREICEENSGMPVVVNMSFSLLVETNNDSAIKANLIAQFDKFNDIVEDLCATYSQLVFVAAAGNENLDACTPTETVAYTNGSEVCEYCVMWPQQTFGRTYDPLNDMFIRVGSIVYSTNERSSFSNFGSCVFAAAFGSSICAWMYGAMWNVGQSVDGTSFSSPLVAAAFALYFSGNPTKTRSDAIAYMQNNARSIPVANVGVLPLLTAETLSKGQPVGTIQENLIEDAYFTQSGKSSDDLNTAQAGASSGSLINKLAGALKLDATLVRFLLIFGLVVLVVALLSFSYFRSRRKPGSNFFAHSNPLWSKQNVAHGHNIRAM